MFGFTINMKNCSLARNPHQVSLRGEVKVFKICSLRWITCGLYTKWTVGLHIPFICPYQHNGYNTLTLPCHPGLFNKQRVTIFRLINAPLLYLTVFNPLSLRWNTGFLIASYRYLWVIYCFFELVNCMSISISLPQRQCTSVSTLLSSLFLSNSLMQELNHYLHSFMSFDGKLWNYLPYYVFLSIFLQT